jgi:two-component system response regulator NreC
MSIKVILADDHRIMREGLRALLEKESDIEVIGQAADGRTALQLARRLSPDVVVMDISMPDLNGIVATRKIVDEVHGIKVIALSMHSSSQFVTGMLKAGASGYLLKDCAFEELSRAIRTVSADGIYLSPDIAGLVIEGYLHQLPGTAPPTHSPLTSRELEVLQLLAEGKTKKHIASLLHVSVKTVGSHRRRIAKKLGISSDAELIKYAVREGLTSLEP